MLPVLPGSYASTTVAAGSNGVALPTATINVADTSSFTSAGYLVINGPPGANIETVVTYTGKTGTTFTGCNSIYRGLNVGIATGTLATAQVVRQANVEWDYPTGYLWQIVVDIAMTSIPTASYCAVRLRSIDNFFNFAIFTTTDSGQNIATGSTVGEGQHILLTGQPGTLPTTPTRIEVFHNSGSVKNSSVDGIQAPSIMQAMMSSR